MVYKTNSPKETENIAKAFAKKLEKGDVLCLSGDLGVGKTAFVQGLAKGLGIEEYISSPTFTIVNCYSGKLPFYHFDVYRIGDSEEMYEIGYEELRRAIDRYQKELQKDKDWRKPQNGSTFFNSGYVDYLDANYSGDQTQESGQTMDDLDEFF